jgi:UDP:flavonoid glycosyltransferase YjiC (YdhE family)
VLVAGGTRGDVQPMVALALELRRREHRVVLAAPPNFADWVSSHGLDFRPLGQDPQLFLTRHGLNLRRALHALKDDMHREFATLEPLVGEADLVLGASVTCAGPSLAARRGIPYLYAVFCPALIASARHPSPFVPWMRLPRWVNRLTWWAHRRTWNRLFRDIMDEERARLGLPGVREAWDHLMEGPLLVAADPTLAPLPDDAPARAESLGPWFLPEHDELPADLERFLGAGPPPVYIGFGSMVGGKAKESTAALLSAVRAAGVRAVIGRGWAGLGEGVAAADDVHLAGPVPHGKLFPRVAAVVHHGGAGTTANAARAGVPQLLIPHILDQHYWAARVADLGLGPAALGYARLTAPRLTQRLRALVGDAGYAARARQLAGTIPRDGVQRAADRLEALAGPGATREVA